MDYQYIEFKVKDIERNLSWAREKATTLDALVRDLNAQNERLYQAAMQLHNEVLERARKIYPAKVMTYLKQHEPAAPVRSKNRRQADKFRGLLQSAEQTERKRAQGRASYRRRKARTEMMYQDLRAWLVNAGYTPGKDFTDNPPNVFWFVSQHLVEWFGDAPRNAEFAAMLNQNEV